MEGENSVNRLRYREKKEEERRDIYKDSGVPYALLAECLAISSAKPQLGQVHMQHSLLKI
jgi:hypothetical protein